jgi:hypothetical protein
LISVRSEVQVLPGPPLAVDVSGAVAQLGERLLCKQDVVGSIPSGSTICLAFHSEGKILSLLMCPPGYVSLLFVIVRICFIRLLAVGPSGPCRGGSLGA